MIWNEYAEQAIIGSCLLQFRPATPGKLRPEHFASYAHQQIWAAMLAITDTGIQLIDLVSLRDELGDELDKIGGDDFLLAIAESTPSSSNFDHWAKIILDCWTRRELIGLGKSAMDQEKDLDEIRIGFDGILKQSLMHTNVPLVSRIGTIEINEPKPGILTGISELDKHTTCGGFPTGQMSMVAAYAKVGKSSFMIQTAVRAALDGKQVLYATFADLGADGLELRVMKNLTGFSRRPNEPHMIADWEDWRYRFQTQHLIDVYDAAGIETGHDVETFSAWLDANRRYDVVFVDYAQELRSRDKRAATDLTEASMTSSLMTRLARRTGLPIIVGSQITEGNEKAGTKDKTKGSRVWEERAGLVLYLTKNDETTEAVIKVAYNRFGPTGKVVCYWDKKHLKFEQGGMN